MVERPIKKSERQAHAAESDVADKALESEFNQAEDNQEQGLKADTPSREERGPKRQDRSRDRKRGRRGQQKTQETSRVNPALLRGPKPSKLKPPTPKEEEAIPADSPIMEEEAIPADSPIMEEEAIPADSPIMDEEQTVLTES